MFGKKYAKNMEKFFKEEDKREKMTVLISAENKARIKEMKINASKLIDAFLDDFFSEVEKKKIREEARKKVDEKSEKNLTI